MSDVQNILNKLVEEIISDASNEVEVNIVGEITYINGTSFRRKNDDDRKEVDEVDKAFYILQTETENYLQYLADEILQLAEGDPVVMKALTTFVKHRPVMRKVGRDPGDTVSCPVEVDTLVKYARPTRDYLDEEIRAVKTVTASNQQLNAVIDKYHVVKQVKDALDDKKPVKKIKNLFEDREDAELDGRVETPLSLSQRIEKARNIVKDNEKTLEKDRDSWGQKFLKVCATLITVGIAAAFGIWKVKGKKYADQVSKTAGTLFSASHPSLRQNGPVFESEVASRPR